MYVIYKKIILNIKYINLENLTLYNFFNSDQLFFNSFQELNFSQYKSNLSNNYSYYDIIFNTNQTIYNLIIVILIIYGLIWFLLSQTNNLSTTFFMNSTFDAEKYSPYECGFAPFKTERSQFDIKFYLIALLFLVFDVELMFILPYCISYNYLGISGYLIFLIFFIILLLGFLVEWASGMLIWKGDRINQTYKKSIFNKKLTKEENTNDSLKNMLSREQQTMLYLDTSSKLYIYKNFKYPPRYNYTFIDDLFGVEPKFF